MSESVVARKGSRGPSEAPSAAKSYAGAAFNALMEEGSKESIVVMLLEAWDQKRDLLAALKGAQGYLMNARIDLESGAPKKTAINTIGGGIQMVRAAIAKAEGVEERPPSAESASTPPPSKAPNT